MGNNFFEGKDFEKEFKPLSPKYYPKEYQNYIKEETNIVSKLIKGSNRILDAGVGTGRMISLYAPHVNEYVGIDNADYMIKQSSKFKETFSNLKIIKDDLENIDKIYSKDYFDYSLILWNTLGNVNNEVKILSKLSFVTSKSILVTTFLKGNLEKRKEWYKSVGIELDNIDVETETFYSKSGLESRSYSLDDFKDFAKKANLKVKSHKILAGVCIFVEFSKDF